MIYAKHNLKHDREKKEEHHIITVKGHANYDDSGRDIVCSAVSALVQSLIATLDIWNDEDLVKEPGNVQIRYTCADYDDYAHAAIDMLVIGIGCLEETYPEYVEMVEDED